MKIPRLVWIAGAAGGIYALYNARDKIRAMILGANGGTGTGADSGVNSVGGKPIATIGATVGDTGVSLTIGTPVIENRVGADAANQDPLVGYGSGWDGGADGSGAV